MRFIQEGETMIFARDITAEQRQILSTNLKRLRNYKFPACFRCGKKPVVKSHTISNCVLKRIADKQNTVILVESGLQSGGFGFRYRAQGISKVSLFRAVCNKHDQDFAPADQADLDHCFDELYTGDEVAGEDIRRILFLWSYRAMLLEWFWKTAANNILTEQSDDLQMTAIQNARSTRMSQSELDSCNTIVDIWEQSNSLSYANFGKIVERWNQLFDAGKWNELEFRCIRLKCPPTIAASRLFSLDVGRPLHPDPGSVAVSVLPSPSYETTVVVYAALPENAADMDHYLSTSGILWATDTDSDMLRRNITSQLLRDIETFAIKPDFWENIPIDIRKDMLGYFTRTMDATLPLIGDLRFNLFTG